MSSAAFRKYYVLLAVFLAVLSLGVLYRDGLRTSARSYLDRLRHKDGPGSDNPPAPSPPPPPSPARKYLPKPSWMPPPIRDPFPSLANTLPPPVPLWNQPKENLHLQYDLNYAPPLLIGFTRTWPILLQAVVSYITAGWPPAQIYVIENTGVQRANERRNLTLQNPFFLDHEQLKKLGVHIVQTPVLLSFAQLQNFYIHLSHVHAWPQYFWSHMDVLALSYEDGEAGVTSKAGEPGYKTVYELCLKALKEALDSKERWSQRLFAYDHLTLVNRDAYEDVGGWDTLIPYYMTDCDMYSRLDMRGWKSRDIKAGIVFDVASVLDDFRAFYRDASVEPDFIDPNPAPLKDEHSNRKLKTRTRTKKTEVENSDLEYWHKIRKTGERMDHHKHGDRGRNTWQLGQHGGQGEPFYYHPRGIAQGIDVLTDAGKEVFSRKWGHRDCDLIGGGHLHFDDQWLVEKDW